VKNFIESKLSIKLLIVVIISFIIAVFSAEIFSRNTFYPYITNNRENIDASMFNFIASMIFLEGMLTFIIVFYLIINKKINYIKYISEKVGEISKGNIGYTIDVKGNDEIAELCNSINIMSLELKEKFDKERENERIKNDLIINVSHDLRTPLTSIIGYLEIIKDKKYKDEKSMEQYIKSAYNTSIKMKKLVNELFEYTKLYNADFKLRKVDVDLASLINQIAGEYIPIFEQNNLILEQKIEDTELKASIDVDQFMRVLDNFLTNALKYAYKPSKVLIEANKVENKVKITVKNKGDNISEDEIYKIFDKFYKIDKSRKDSLNGSGIGLSIAKKIMELHEGKIWAECKDSIISFSIII